MASNFDDSFLQDVRGRNNIVEVIGSYVSLRKAGGRLKGLCPFHQEKTPSFTVNEQQQFFYCFGCQTGGDVISFVREMHGYGFQEALRHLAERAGLEVPERRERPPIAPGSGPRRARGREEKDRYYRVGKAAMTFYRDTYGAMEGAPCRSYVQGRGLEPEVIDLYGVGMAPDRWDGLSRHLATEGERGDVAQELGLTAPRKSGDGSYDRFRNRLMFPIRNLAGDVIGFSGRAQETSAIEDYTERAPAKYINSPDSPVFQKGEILFGLFEARQALRKAGVGIVVEGNVDVLRLCQEGFTNVVAPLGTALTASQCRLLRRFVEVGVLMYDGDRAGRAAALKAIPISMGEGLKVQVVRLPDGQDPDTYLLEEGAEALKQLVEGAPSGWRYLVDAVLDEVGFAADPAAGAAAAVDRLAPVLEAIPDRRERGLRIRSLAEDLHLRDAAMEDFLVEARRKIRPAFQPDEPAGSENHEATASVRPSPPPPDRELALLRLMLHAPDAVSCYRGQDAGRWITASPVRDALEELADATEQELEIQPGLFVSSLKDLTLRKLLGRALVDETPSEGASGEAKVVLRQLQVDYLSRRLRNRKRELDSVNKTGDDDAAMVAVAEIRRFAQEIEALKRETL